MSAFSKSAHRWIVQHWSVRRSGYRHIGGKNLQNCIAFIAFFYKKKSKMRAIYIMSAIIFFPVHICLHMFIFGKQSDNLRVCASQKTLYFLSLHQTSGTSSFMALTPSVPDGPCPIDSSPGSFPGCWGCSFQKIGWLVVAGHSSSPLLGRMSQKPHMFYCEPPAFLSEHLAFVCWSTLPLP